MKEEEIITVGRQGEKATAALIEKEEATNSTKKRRKKFPLLLLTTLRKYTCKLSFLVGVHISSFDL